MKIAIPVRDGQVDGHFGHAEKYSVVTVSPDNKILKNETIEATQGCGCRSGIAETLAREGVTIMLAGNIGAGAINHLYYSGIDVVRGCAGPVEEVVYAFLNGQIQDSNQVCKHHDHEGCDHKHDDNL
jgi:predicted Fe-Mo cluster-binding NifX family protein